MSLFCVLWHVLFFSSWLWVHTWFNSSSVLESLIWVHVIHLVHWPVLLSRWHSLPYLVKALVSTTFPERKVSWRCWRCHLAYVGMKDWTTLETTATFVNSSEHTAGHLALLAQTLAQVCCRYIRMTFLPFKAQHPLLSCLNQHVPANPSGDKCPKLYKTAFALLRSMHCLGFVGWIICPFGAVQPSRQVQHLI